MLDVKKFTLELIEEMDKELKKRAEDRAKMKAKFNVGDKVRILDGSKIKNYTCGWNEQDMGKYIGKIYTIRALHDWGNRIGYMLNGAYWYEFDERGLEAVNKDQKIIITADSKTTTARLFDGKSLIKSADAKCHPDDKFDFEIGAKIAFDRLINKEKTENYFNGYVRCIKSESVFFEVDKIYKIVDGCFVNEERDNIPFTRPPFKTIEEFMHKRKSEKFIEIKPKELLQNGVFGRSKNFGWFVVVENKLVFEKSGYLSINKYDNELIAEGLYSKLDEIEVIVNARSFDGAKQEIDIIWRRNNEAK